MSSNYKFIYECDKQINILFSSLQYINKSYNNTNTFLQNLIINCKTDYANKNKLNYENLVANISRNWKFVIYDKNLKKSNINYTFNFIDSDEYTCINSNYVDKNLKFIMEIDIRSYLVDIINKKFNEDYPNYCNQIGVKIIRNITINISEKTNNNKKDTQILFSVL